MYFIANWCGFTAPLLLIVKSDISLNWIDSALNMNLLINYYFLRRPNIIDVIWRWIEMPSKSWCKRKSWIKHNSWLELHSNQTIRIRAWLNCVAELCVMFDRALLMYWQISKWFQNQIQSWLINISFKDRPYLCRYFFRYYYCCKANFLSF